MQYGNETIKSLSALSYQEIENEGNFLKEYLIATKTLVEEEK